jgi:hypothetical protein
MRLLRGLGSETLPCGCLVGTYETYEGRIVTIVDAPAPTCPRRDHGLHAIVSTQTDAAVTSGPRPTRPS